MYLAARRADRLGAVKVIRAEHVADAQFRARFRHEVAAAPRVRPFCTAPVVDAGPPCLATEFVAGRILSDCVAARGPLGGADLEALAVGVVAALPPRRR
ncbi:hypothetical protein [Amycolatopsis sp. NPDC051903]|uniref:hypothetical protein n=1 Tax=Amycolatopsis sp. NPDC051903 TaxID=3363936 RepID=UPI0037993DF6